MSSSWILGDGALMKKKIKTKVYFVIFWILLSLKIFLITLLKNFNRKEIYNEFNRKRRIGENLQVRDHERWGIGSQCSL